MSRNETLDFPGPVGRLEAILMHPVGTPEAAAVVCHAHPAHGGIMHFKPVFRAARALQEQGLAALRFNFRGVGRSEGSYDLGRGEQEDVRAALDETGRRFPGLPLVLGGFSFGATMALRVGAREDRVRAVFALGFPLAMTPDPEFLRGWTKPRLFVQGEHDRFGDGPSLRSTVEGLDGPRTVAVVPGSDHFFLGHLEPLAEAISAWAASRPWRTT